MTGIEIAVTGATVLLVSFATVVLVPCTFLLIEVVASTWPSRRGVLLQAPSEAPAFAVLMPAHNEATAIAASLSSLLAQLRAADRMLVVADNCNDATADIARSMGAEVSERFDDQHRGKGYALDHGRRVLAASAPAVVIAVDADCLVGEGALARLANRALNSGRPIQARYDMLPSADADVGQRIAAFAWRVKNLTRPRGADRLGLPCLLTGSGMAFQWSKLEHAALASGNIVEDMQLGLDLACQGHAPQFCEEALVTSQFAPTDNSRRTQRQRWEHGHLATLLSQAPRLVHAAIAQRQPRLLGLCLELCVPPLALLAALTLGVTTLAVLWGWLSAVWLPGAMSLVAMASLSLAVVLAWHADGRALVSARDFMSVPSYVLSKFSIYAAFLVRRESRWVRTERPRDD